MLTNKKIQIMIYIKPILAPPPPLPTPYTIIATMWLHTQSSSIQRQLLKIVLTNYQMFSTKEALFNIRFAFS